MDKKQNEATDSTCAMREEKTPIPAPSSWNLQDDMVERGHWVETTFQRDGETSGEVNMEAFITPDDVVLAGGLGARDDISSFLPVASDSTDFEASIRDAREYEEPQVKICRPGLGWKDDSEKK